ncbi:MAG: hypothetical protein OEY94_06415 [Alphaproteobacteria bacterium]|nr:hypothetical protein [Alphaproteobacteria bacterium]
MLSQDLIWWITVFDLPALSALFWMIWRTRNENRAETDRLHKTLDVRCDQLREALSAFKLEVAKNYASQKDLRALEDRLVSHLLRIESKLDSTAIKTAELTSKSGK